MDLDITHYSCLQHWKFCSGVSKIPKDFVGIALLSLSDIHFQKKFCGFKFYLKTFQQAMVFCAAVAKRFRQWIARSQAWRTEKGAAEQRLGILRASEPLGGLTIFRAILSSRRL